MERYTIAAPPTLTRDDHAGRIEAFLQAQGFQTNGATVRWDDDGRCRVTVLADRDPTEAMQQYVPTLAPEERWRYEQQVEVAVALDAIERKPEDSRTPAERVLLALAPLSQPLMAARELME